MTQDVNRLELRKDAAPELKGAVAITAHELSRTLESEHVHCDMSDAAGLWHGSHSTTMRKWPAG